MTINEFTNKVKNLIQHRLGNDYYISTENVTKNNGLVLHGLSIHRKGLNAAPTVYMESFYSEYESGRTLESIVFDIIRLCMENERAFDLPNFYDFESVKGKIIFQLVNTAKNAALLEKIPSKKFLDFSIIFRILFEDNPEGIASAIITNDHVNIWKTSIDKIYRVAMVNTPALQKAVIRSMDDMLSGFIDDDSRETIKMYVLTNEKILNGCGCILYPHILENFGETLGNSFYILPSSVHEVILLPDIAGDSDSLIQIVREINRTAVSQEDFLSDNVYYFSRETRAITTIQ